MTFSYFFRQSYPFLDYLEYPYLLSQNMFQLILFLAFGGYGVRGYLGFIAAFAVYGTAMGSLANGCVSLITHEFILVIILIATQRVAF